MTIKFTEEQLNTLDKSFIVELFLQLQEQNEKLSDELQSLNKKLELLIEQVTLSNKNRFGKSSEKMSDASQICFMEVDMIISCTFWKRSRNIWRIPTVHSWKICYRGHQIFRKVFGRLNKQGHSDAALNFYRYSLLSVY